MRLPDIAHSSQPWRIHAIATEFRLEDVWRLAASDDPACFREIVHLFADGDASLDRSAAVRALFAIRWKLGALLGWDRAEAGVGARTPSLRERLPADLSAGPRGPEFADVPFSPLYLTDDEFAAEIANGTVHGVLHLGRVSRGLGAPSIQMAVLVKPNGLLGAGYMAAIKPFRHLIVYPTLTREISRAVGARSSRAPACASPAGH